MPQKRIELSSHAPLLKKQKPGKRLTLPGLRTAEPRSCSLIYLGANVADPARCRPEKAPAGQHEQRRQQTFMSAQVIGHSSRFVKASHCSVRFKPISIVLSAGLTRYKVRRMGGPTALFILIAQLASGAMTGVVKDQAGAAVAGATIILTELSTNHRRTVTSSADGVYSAPSLPPGEYRLDVELAGFRPVRRSGVRIETGATARVDFTLVVGDVREEVLVTGDAPAARTESASLGA